nr:hypothetical protein HK105_000700 [Polyrhizophydium stewartii]
MDLDVDGGLGLSADMDVDSDAAAAAEERGGSPEPASPDVAGAGALVLSTSAPDAPALVRQGSWSVVLRNHEARQLVLFDKDRRRVAVRALHHQEPVRRQDLGRCCRAKACC